MAFSPRIPISFWRSLEYREVTAISFPVVWRRIHSGAGGSCGGCVRVPIKDPLDLCPPERFLSSAGKTVFSAE